jgi:DNA-binding CsgD family transcriptional regulator
VKFHLGSAMTKLAASSRAEAVAMAIRRGLISV